MVRAIMHGCNGHMGQTITALCKDDPGIEIVAGIDLYDGIANEYPVFKSLEECTEDADVIIDFANAAAVDGLLEYSRKKADSGSAVYNRPVGGAAAEGGENKPKSGGAQIG